MPMHLALAAGRAWAAMAALPGSSGGSRRQGSLNDSSGWSTNWPGFAPRSAEGRREAARILGAVRGRSGPDGPDGLRAAVWRHLLEEDAALLRGLVAYRTHPYARDLPDPPSLWAEGPARLLDFGGPGPAILLVPSLVNRAFVLDLAEGRSMCRWLSASGVRPILLDWGWPGAEESGFTLTDWIAGRLERALAAAVAAARGPVLLLGYCMGGLLTLAAALRRPDLVRGLVLLATPWDFHAGGEEERSRARAAAALLPALEAWMEPTGALPVDVLNALFAGLDPYGIARKFRAFGRLDPASAKAAHFVALEDWLNDGVPLPAPVARECLGGWYGENTPARGLWRVAGAPVRPEAWRGPSLVAIPRGDRIVPPESARALAEGLSGATVLDVPAGHIGMAAGAGAEAVLWRPLRDWCRAAA
ncbi:alpha/beta fold hydrolase [Roseomonas sp. CCTCC AB2023176]|uniref:alpha/beta fold hydrolase n=1 Tax=Roseomonas sp. CCTCC AB2023176 TaxID=3342640 RepID=UPI0035DCD301